MQDKPTTSILYPYDVIVWKFIPYKFVQYLNGLHQKILKKEAIGCTCADFLRHFEKEVYPDDKEILRKGIVDILNDNKTKGYFEDVPTPVSEQYERDIIFEYTDFDEIICYYEIKV